MSSTRILLGLAVVVGGIVWAVVTVFAVFYVASAFLMAGAIDTLSALTRTRAKVPAA